MKIMCTPPPQTLFDCNESLNESECERFKKFELLWEHGRETHNAKGFEGTLLKVLDQLALPYHASIRTFVTKWLQESLLHGDLSRLIRPLLKIMLGPSTKRISVVHAHLIKRDADDNASDSLYDRSDEMDGENVADKDVYAISSEDGNVKYHIEMARSKKRSPIRSLQKKFFGVTIGNKNKTSNYISDKSALPSESARYILIFLYFRLHVSHESFFSNISLIVNPLDNSSDFEAGDSENCSLTCSASAPTRIEASCNEPGLNQPTLKEGYYSSCEEETDESYSETESERHEESVERDNPPQTCDMKRFSGDCERVVDVLTEHDRTKNRKTYQV